MTGAVLLALGAIFRRLVVGPSTNTDFGRVHKIIDNVGYMLVCKVVGRGAIYVRSVDVDIFRVSIDLGGLYTCANKQSAKAGCA